MNLTQFVGGADIKINFYQLYQELFDGKACDEYSDEEIYKLISKYEGYGLSGFSSMDAFEALIQPQLRKIREPAVTLNQKVYTMLVEISRIHIERLFNKFP